MTGTTIISIGAWISVWVLFALFIRHIFVAEQKYKKIRNTMIEMLNTQQEAQKAQKEFHKMIGGLMVGINENMNTLKEVNIDNVTEIIRKEVDQRLKHVAQ